MGGGIESGGLSIVVEDTTAEEVKWGIEEVDVGNTLATRARKIKVM